MTTAPGHGPPLAASSRPRWLRATLTYVGLFVSTAVVFGGFEAAQTGSITHGLLRGLFFGLAMSTILGTAVVVGQRENTGSWSPRRHATVVVPDGLDLARHQALVALGELRARVSVDEPTQLSARTGFSWKTWGTRIDLAFATDRGATTVDIRIRPRVPTTLVDYGAAHRTLQVLTYFLTPREAAPRSHP